MSNELEGKIGDRLKSYREACSYNQQQFANKLDIKQQSLSKYENGHQSIPDEIKLKLIKDKVNINWLLTGQGDMFVKSTEENKTINNDNVEDEKEIQSNVATSLNIEDVQKAIEIIKLVNSETNANYLMPVPLELSSHGEKLKAMIVKSDSMEPTIKRYSIVLFDMLGYVGEGVYVIKLEGTYFIKRITCIDNVYKLNSDNKAYDSIELPTESSNLEIEGQIKSVTNIMY